MNADQRQLLTHADSVKRRFLAMYKEANAGHVGCSLSCAEMLVFVKFGWMHDNDTLVLSKGHAAAAFYSLLAEAGTLSDVDIASFYKNGTHLSAHPPINKIPGIPFATGSLGHGLSLCAGMALGARMKKERREFFCITSDGELNEGSVWEAALFIAQMKLDDIVWLIDRNQIQGIGRTEEVMKLEPVADKLRAFGFFVASADGHDFSSLRAAKELCEKKEQPKAIICNTIKGHGIASWEDTVDCHYLPMTDAQYEEALASLEPVRRGGGIVRAEFAQAMLDVCDRHEKTLFMSGDLGYMALERVIEKFGDRFINAGVAEQNMVSVAAGLAYEGFVPWIYSIAPFAILRPYEQIRNDVCLHNLPVKIVGNGGGFGYGIMGATHHTLEDIGIMRALPNMKVYVPLAPTDVGEAVDAMTNDPSPNYLRLNLGVKFDTPLAPFQQWRKVKDGSRAVMISTGPIVGGMLDFKGSPLFDDFEIWTVGILPVTELPDALRSSIRAKGKVVTLEEHRGQCGLNETVGALILRSSHRAIAYEMLYAEGYISGKYGNQRWHQEENGLAGEPLRARLNTFLAS